MITGFRLDTGGAQAKYDVRPDLTTFGKVIGGGLPIGAVGGRRDVMETLTPLGPVFHAGTLAGNPLATAAGLAALDQLDARRLHRAGGARPPPRRAAARRLRGGRLPGRSSRSSARSSGWCAATCPAPVDFDGAKRTDEAAYAAFFQAMLAEGVAMAPGAYEAIFVGLGHDDAVLDELGERAGRAAAVGRGPRSSRRRAAARGGAASSVRGRCGRCSRGGSSRRSAPSSA